MTTDEIIQEIMDKHREYVGVKQTFYGHNAVQRMIIAALARGAEQAIGIVRNTRDGFLSDQYATPQPLGSIQERFACDQCVDAIEQSVQELTASTQMSRHRSRP